LFFLTQALKVDGATANLFVAASLIIGTPFFIVFGALSDKIGRKPIIMLGCLLAVLSYFFVFEQLTKAANPDLHAAQQTNKVVVMADPAECSFQFNPTGTVKFTSSCDIAKQKLAGNSVSYSNEIAAPGTPAIIKVGETVISTVVTPEDVAAAKETAEKKLEALKAADPVDPKAVKKAEDALKNLSDEKKSRDAVITANLSATLKNAGYPAKADPNKINQPVVILILTYLVLLVTMVYGPIAAMLVEETFAGATELLSASGQSPTELRKQVTSPNGTTMQAVAVMEQAELSKIFTKATEAALARAKEIAAGK
jgi:hypothetical protein